MSITQVVEPDLAAERALTETLTANMRVMYQRGVADGVQNILNILATNLDKVSSAKECPEKIKAGFVEASKYIKAVHTGQPYQLSAEASDEALPSADVADKVAQKISAKFKNKKHPLVSPEARA